MAENDPPRDVAIDYDSEADANGDDDNVFLDDAPLEALSNLQNRAIWALFDRLIAGAINCKCSIETRSQMRPWMRPSILARDGVRVMYGEKKWITVQIDRDYCANT